MTLPMDATTPRGKRTFLTTIPISLVPLKMTRKMTTSMIAAMKAVVDAAKAWNAATKETALFLPFLPELVEILR